MTTELATVGNSLVMRDAVKTWRWFDAFGPAVTKWEFNPNQIPLASSTTVSGYTVTNVNGTLVFVAGADGGAINFVPAGAENDGIQLQPVTEGFYFAARWPAYFGVKLQASDVDQVDLFAGLSITDTDACTAVTDGIFFWSVDESAACTFNVEKNSVNSQNSVATLVDATDILLEFAFDGTNVTAYVNGTEMASVAYTSASFPNDEYLTPILGMLTGATAANTMTVSWARAIQLREAV
jgi:hypothetical protein